MWEYWFSRKTKKYMEVRLNGSMVANESTAVDSNSMKGEKFKYLGSFGQIKNYFNEKNTHEEVKCWILEKPCYYSDKIVSLLELS